MRIIFDGQVLQSSSSNRGIGIYIENLIYAVAERSHADGNEVFIFINGSISRNIEEIVTRFSGVIESDQVLCWNPMNDSELISQKYQHSHKLRELLEYQREMFLSEFSPDVVHVGNVFEGGDVISSVRKFKPDVVTTATLHDLIPFIHQDTYLPNLQDKVWYNGKVQDLLNTNALLCNSESSCSEVEYYLNPRDSKVYNVSGSCSRDYESASELSSIDHLWLSGIGITKPFILSTVGEDPRKNLERTIEAFARLVHLRRNGLQLVFGGNVSDSLVERLKSIALSLDLDSSEIVFSGKISDRQMRTLYATCEVFVFSSWHEGLGLPAIEAMKMNAPLLAADIDVMRKITNLGESLFDPYNVTDISDKLHRVLTSNDFKKKLIYNGVIQAKRYNWRFSARDALSAWDEIICDSNKARTL